MKPLAPPPPGPEPMKSRPPADRVRQERAVPDWLFAVLLVAATFIAYLPALSGGFVWDDDAWTVNLVDLHRSLAGLARMWLDVTALTQYYPLTGSTFWLDYHFWGFHTLPYHVENVLLHAAAALLFWHCLRRLQVGGARLAAAIFALHPVMVESVAWITERKNVFSLVLYLGAFLAYGSFRGFWSCAGDSGNDVPTARGARRGAYALAFLLFIAALLSKTTAFSFPAVILLVGWWRRGRVRWRADVLPTLPFFAVGITGGLLISWLEKNNVGAAGPEWALGFPERCFIAGRAFWFYVGKLLWPAHLCFVYPRWRPEAGSALNWLWPASVLALLVGLWAGRRRLGRGPATAAFFFVGTLLPMLGFINAYSMRYSFVWDHWVYLSSLGPIALFAALIDHGLAGLASWSKPEMRWCRGVSVSLCVALLASLWVLTWRQSHTYASLETLWRATLARNPHAGLAHNNLGTLLLGEGRVDEAMEHFKKALAVEPHAADVHCNLGSALLQQGLLEPAIAQFREAVRLQPELAMAHNNLGSTLLRQGQLEEAILELQEAVKFQPKFASAHCNLASALLQAGRADESIAQLQQAIAIQPDMADAYLGLGNALLSKAQVADAITNFRKAVELQPELASTHYSLANALLQARQLDEAAGEFRKALALQPSFAPACNGLGNALLQKGQPDEALACYRQALSLDPRLAEAHLNLANLLVQRHQPDEAIAHFRAALEIDPGLAAAHNNLANALLGKGQVDDAIAQFQEALKLQPNLAEAHNGLANALLRQGRVAEAVTHYEAAVAAVPRHPYLLNNLAWVLATCPDASIRNGARALELAQQADRVAGGQDPVLLGTVAAAYAETGQFPQAVATAQRALGLALAQTNATQVATLQSRLKLYQAGSPFRDTELSPRPAADKRAPK
ncbi:MAG TPA: tetratricopeptide repeat protein [Candidatus Acidoferrum sp.]|nr:tetratricopeptide repeat protein [Candidatus Acidoferrum sp.]